MTNYATNLGTRSKFNPISFALGRDKKRSVKKRTAVAEILAAAKPKGAKDKAVDAIKALQESGDIIIPETQAPAPETPVESTPQPPPETGGAGTA